jgi:LuxR family transcriptional regulator, maltose regulon positive regulatory protein
MHSPLPSDAVPPLLASNLHVPQIPREIVLRELLLEKLDLALGVPLTVVSAPPGFGKTTLLSQWIASRQDQAWRNLFAWVSLEDEVDLLQFWRYVFAALEGAQAGMGQPALAMLEGEQPAINTILRTLLNKIAAAPDNTIIILDDYHHAADPAIHTTLTFFINNLPPNLHLVIASRSQPALALARWRASNQLHELREADLRFTPAEVAAFLNDVKGLNLSDDELAALEVRTEGWVAGLHLVALSLLGSDAAARQRVVAAFTGSQRYILDYLMEEVLQQQPEAVRTFLLQTSVLAHLTAALCNAVTGQDDGQVMLEYLERANLFIIPLDHERRWYRYHQLFRDVLRNRLQQMQEKSVCDLHRRAAAWCAAHGEEEEAIRHAYAAEDWQQAVELMAPRVSADWSRGEVRKIITWLGRLPGEVLDGHPSLFLYYARALMLGGQMAAAEQRLQAAEVALRGRMDMGPAADDRARLGAICALRTTVAAVSGEARRAQALGQEALSFLPPENTDLRAHATNSLGVTHFFRGEMEEAKRACAAAGRLAREVGNLYLVMVAATYQAEALACQGLLLRAGEVLRQALDLSNPASWPGRSRIPAASVVCAGYGALLYEWNRLDEAERYLTEAIELGQQLAFGGALWTAYQTLFRLRLALGDYQGAQALREQAQHYRQGASVPLPARLLDAEQARACLAVGQVVEAERWAQAYRQEAPEESLGYVREIENLTAARLYLRQDRPAQALALLNRIRPGAEAGNRGRHVVEILALTALAQEALGESQRATGALQQALVLAAPEGYLRTFVDEGPPMAALLYQALAEEIMAPYVSRLLASFPVEEEQVSVPGRGDGDWHASADRQRLVEPLTAREVEVLQLMAGGASNQAIADQLTIATTTAKKHVSNIIQKLGATNRTQAVARGHQLGLC